MFRRHAFIHPLAAAHPCPAPSPHHRARLRRRLRRSGAGPRGPALRHPTGLHVSGDERDGVAGLSRSAGVPHWVLQWVARGRAVHFASPARGLASRLADWCPLSLLQPAETAPACPLANARPLPRPCADGYYSNANVTGRGRGGGGGSGGRGGRGRGGGAIWCVPCAANTTSNANHTACT